jgi:hypothetical protein
MEINCKVLTERTVWFHLISIFNKLGADNCAQVVAIANQLGMGSLGSALECPRIWGASARTHARIPNPDIFTAIPKDPGMLSLVLSSVTIECAKSKQ